METGGTQVDIGPYEEAVYSGAETGEVSFCDCLIFSLPDFTTLSPPIPGP